MNLQERVLLKKANRDELYCLEPPFPTTNFLIETSNACNHACIFCAHQKMKRKIGKINTEFVFDILKQAQNLELFREEQLKQIEALLAEAGQKAQQCGVTMEELHELLDLVNGGE